MQLTMNSKKLTTLLLGSAFAFCSTLCAQQLVLRGDYPDPSVVKIGDRYWATATTSNWAPAYPILESKDLVNWKTVGHVFTDLPDWADYYFWAPEISYEKGKVYLYYAAHKKNGNLCVGVASADKPEGPYKDHGPLMCQEVGSMDAFPMRDENGKLYLIWKEDANSVGKPTPIWAMEMNEERTALAGEKKELFRNNVKWEANLVEGVSMTKHGEYFYAFYAAAGCCGAACTYGVGIARSKTLLGPWEKYSGNPVIAGNEKWTCPGHGTPIEKGGRHYFMYHAYDKKSNIYTGRQGLLIEYDFTPSGWIIFAKKEHPVSAGIKKITDEFTGNSLSLNWQWSVFKKPNAQLKDGTLFLQADTTSAGAFLGQKIITGNYTATAKLDVGRSSAAGGVAAIGDDNNIISAVYDKGTVKILQVKQGKKTELGKKAAGKSGAIYLRMQV